MSGYTVCTAVVLLGALPATLGLSWFGRPVDRLVGLELTSAVSVVALLLISQVTGQSYELIVPLVLVVMSVAGTLVFTRLLERRPQVPEEASSSGA
jgi:multisubunit Na+/H+ antiporter MnhF subunit